MPEPVLIVGGGQAAVQLCLALRKEKYTGGIVVCSDEAELPYHRPPLSKAYITGQTTDEELCMRPSSFYQSRDVDLRLNSAVTAIDCASKSVKCASEDIPYGYLVLAMGAKARSIPLPGLDAGGVFVLRDLNDARQIKNQLQHSKRIVIIGAGFIGLEAAAALNKQGNCHVSVFDTADRVMGRAVAPQISRWFEDTHRNAGIDIYLNEAVSEISTDENGNASGVVRTNGETIAADMVLVGVGVEPHTDLASDAGITCDNGIVVDEYCRSSDDAVFAAGDCANHPNVFAGDRQVRLESVQNATDQARTIASVIAASELPGKTPQPYQAVPWFWSDQAEHSLQMTGLSFDADQHVTRGDPASASFSVFHYRADQLLAVDSVNASRDHMFARKLLGKRVSPSPEQAADVGFELKELL